VKPDFWDSADTARANLRTRLLYIAMWNWADDYGIGDGHPGRIITFAFPNDDIAAADYPRLLADVSDAFGVVFFDHLERPYYTVPAWDKHQRTEKKAKPKDGLLEAAAAAVEADVAARQARNAESPRNVADSPTHSDEPSDAGSRKLEREIGKGNEEPCATVLRASIPARFEEFWDTYPRRRDRRKAEKAFANAIKRADPETIISGANRYALDPNRVEQFTKYAEGWLNGDGWMDEPLPPRNGNHGARIPASDAAFAQAQALKDSPHGNRLEIDL
jgi:hypothetical protein